MFVFLFMTPLEIYSAAVTDVSTMDLELEVCGIHTGGTWTDRQFCRAWGLHGFFCTCGSVWRIHKRNMNRQTALQSLGATWILLSMWKCAVYTQEEHGQQTVL